jgi:DNA adenine methylase
MKTPFPYFGSKSKIAPEIWRRFGDPAYYFEPFAGALGVLLGRPSPGKYEFVGDIDCLITNFFRAAKYAPRRKLARLTDWPISQLDLEARTKWLRQQRGRLHRLLADDPKAYDLECAAWYAWVQSARISTNGATIVLGRAAGVRRQDENLEKYFAKLADRLKNVVIHFGDWTRLANAAERLSQRADSAILLDPPYDYSTNRQKNLYAHDSQDVSAYVRRWALARAKTHPKLRIALCGFEGEHEMPSSWEELPWWSNYGRGKERIWFSPNCLKVTEQSLRV